jgi:hypothetical protein
MECTEKFCKDFWNRIPEKEREAIIQDLEKLCQDIGKEPETCCQNHCIMKES